MKVTKELFKKKYSKMEKKEGEKSNPKLELIEKMALKFKKKK